MCLGVLVYAAVTVFVFPDTFKKDDKAVPSYAFPFYIVGTVLLFIGMLFCAIVIERSSEEYYFKPNTPSKVFWLQPGKQNVGDQVFNAFMAVKEGSKSTMTTKMEYIKSVRVRKYDGRHVEIYVTLSSTMMGFIFQFVGLRGMHASVILAQLGSTFVMSILRTCLRTERMPQGENKMRDERELTSHKQQELDCFSFHLRNIDSFEVLAPSSLGISPTESSVEVHQPRVDFVGQLIQTRARLAKLTASSSHGLMVGWDDIPIRKAARNLSMVLESTMDLMSSWGVDFGKSFEFRLNVECQPADTDCDPRIRSSLPIRLLRCGDALRWRVDKAELEAVLGLWVWSLYKSDEDWHQPLNRMVGLTADVASQKETYLLFHKWIFRHTEARLVSVDMIDSSRRLFGFESDRYSYDQEILIVRTENEIEIMAAQDLYINFLKHVLYYFNELGGDTDINTALHDSFLVHNSRVDEMMHCFERCDLGSREDALLCIVPVLRQQKLLPELEAYSANSRRQVEHLIRQGDWKGAFELVRWICQRAEGVELEQSLYELGYLCRRALLDTSKDAQQEGLENICRILDSDIEEDFFDSQRLTLPARWSRSPSRQQLWAMFAKQVGWIAWNISVSVNGLNRIQPNLKTRGVEETLVASSGIGQPAEAAKWHAEAIRDWLTFDHLDFANEHLSQADEEGYEWALKAGYHALLYFMLVRWTELGADCPSLIQHAYSVAARNHCDWGIKVLLRHETDINTLNESNMSALMEVTALGDLEAARTLLDNGAKPDGDEKAPDSRPLLLAAHQGLTEMVRLLLDCGAELEAEDSIGLTALQYASREDQHDTVRYLLCRGADIEKAGLDGVTPLLAAASEGQLEMTQLLLERNANINARDGHGLTPLIFAAKRGHVEILRVLLAQGPNVLLHDYEGRSALSWAKRTHRDDIVVILEAFIGQN